MVESRDVASEVIAVIAETMRVDAASINRETVSDDVNGWDSVTHTTLILDIERKLDVELPIGDVFDVNTVGELIELVVKQTNRIERPAV